MKLNKSPRTDQHPSCTGSVLPASRILLQSTESAGQKEMPCKTHSNIYSSYLYTFLTFIQDIYIPFKQFTQIIYANLKRLVKAGRGKWKTSKDSNHTK